MQAAVLHQAGTPLEVKEVVLPKLQASSVRVRVLATHVLSFTQQVVSGQFFPIPTPYIPGLCAIGIVEAISDDISGIKIGQKVFCSPLISARNNSQVPERILKGWFGITENCQDLLSQWKDGAFAHQTVYPVECITPIELSCDYDDAHLACLYYLCISYGAFLRGEFKPGQSVVINGATGNLGAASVLIALAMGATKVFATGRNTSVLNSLSQLDPHRVCAIQLPENAEDYKAVYSSEIGAADILIDTVGAMDNASLGEAGISILRQHGTAVFVGGVTTDVHLSYLTTLIKELNIKGSFMYPNSAPAEVIKLIQSGALNLKAFHPKVYPLNQVNEAIADAPLSRGLEYTILQP
ncbi:zinc-binding dehydrogenase [Clostridium sp. BL-8]|uniref:zinc-binding dehydrogenase n=1 Tax=Clostridium sp. BL-8 TaxID=349938 RepID=UPI00098C5F03|nr:zinc-binding dehydrogenase [Clostridium sp. BL-8]OOM78091.1 alcohol dehydrogenase [Clostridium sp. BL-8]